MAPYAARSLLFCLYVSAGQCFSSSLSGGLFRGLNRPNSYSDYSSSTQHRSTRFAGEVATAENDTATFEAAAAETEIVVDADDFLKPERDLKDYRYIRLSNNLEVLLVSTAKATSSEEKSSAVEAASRNWLSPTLCSCSVQDGGSDDCTREARAATETAQSSRTQPLRWRAASVSGS